MSDGGIDPRNEKYAWHERTRGGLPKRSASDRVADFLEIYGLYDEDTAREQASRCIQCPNPTCVSGCPLCNPIPQWMQLTAEGRFLEAAAVLGSSSNLPEICARVCPADHLCEGKCLLDAVSEPVSIQAIEQFLIDYAFDRGQVSASTAPPNGKRVAIVGSGPGGLACAEDLARQGFAVTIFDSAMTPGGLLVNGLPAFKLDKSIVQRRIDLLKKRGVVFQLGARWGEEMTLARLREKFDAVFLGWDARQARPLPVPGSDLPGVIQALPFLLQKNTPVPLDLEPVDVAGKNVVVLGGGDTAMDCLRAAIRYGAASACGIYRRDEADMPCHHADYQNAVEEGARFIFCATPLAVLGNDEGRVRGLRLARTNVSPTQTDGRRPFQVLPGTEFEVAADWVIPALGFNPLPCPRTDGFGELKFNDWGGIVVDDQQQTSIPGVFAGGDLVHGPTVVLDAVRDARKAAAQIAVFLGVPAPR